MRKVPMKRSRASTPAISMKIQHAITRFISRTEKIVRTVHPGASIVINSPPPKKRIGRPRKRPLEEEPKPAKPSIIDTPNFKGKWLAS